MQSSIHYSLFIILMKSINLEQTTIDKSAKTKYIYQFRSGTSAITLELSMGTPLETVNIISWILAVVAVLPLWIGITSPEEESRTVGIVLMALGIAGILYTSNATPTMSWEEGLTPLATLKFICWISSILGFIIAGIGLLGRDETSFKVGIPFLAFGVLSLIILPSEAHAAPVIIEWLRALH